MNSSPYTHSYNYHSNTTTMDTNSLCSSEISDGLSNDTFEITRRGRQDVLMDGRLERPFTSRFAGSAADLSFPVSHSSIPVTTACSASSDGKRRVSFGGHKVINDGASESISDEERRIRWWSQTDLDDIKKAAKEMSLRLRKLAKERGCYVETAHKKTSLMLTNSFQELVNMTPSSPDQDLRHWTARSDGRRGLERFACREYGNTRKEDVLGARRAVLQEQERQRQMLVFIPESIAKVAKTNSRRSRTFSLFMGEADAQAQSATRGVARKSSKRVKVSHSQQQQQQQQRHVAPNSAPRSFTVDAPMLISSA